MNPSGPVQRQLDAYNAHDLERITGLHGDVVVEAVAVYQVLGERIRAVWFY